MAEEALLTLNLGISHSSQNLSAGWLRNVHLVQGHWTWLELVNTVEELRMGCWTWFLDFEEIAGVVEVLEDLGVVGMLLLIIVVGLLIPAGATSPNVNKVSIIGGIIGHFITTT